MKILFLDFSTRLKTVDDLQTRARGGMVTSLFKMSDYLAAAGHRVYVQSDIEQAGDTNAGVQWYNDDDVDLLEQETWDFIIFNRGTGHGHVEFKAKHRILWTHDLPHNGFIPEPEIMRAFSGVVFMSRYAEWVWRSFYKTIGKSFLIPNGVDKELFYPRKKDLNYLVYASAPNRGLRRLSLIFDSVSTQQPDVHMNAYSNMEIMHPNEAPYFDCADDWNKIKEESAINYLDPLPQHEFAEEIGKAGLMILPTRYPEICSNVILQALASGTPIVSTGNLGSSGEWIRTGANGYLTDFHVHDYMIHTLQMVRGVVSILGNKKRHLKLIKNATKTKGIYSWKQIGRKWEKMLARLY